jgi:hypothetical protein
MMNVLISSSRYFYLLNIQQARHFAMYRNLHSSDLAWLDLTPDARFGRLYNAEHFRR